MLSFEPRTTIVAGDWHANARWAAAAISWAGERGIRTILHLGDYGFTFDERFRSTVERALADFDMQLLFVRGNHDDTDYLGRLDRDAAGCGVVSTRVRHLVDGQRIRLGGEVALALGGAASIDRSRRIRGVSWWADEITSAATIEAAIAGGPASIVLAHDSPAGVVLPLDPRIGAYFENVDPGVLDYCEENRLRLWEVAAALRPRLWLHGHYHVLTQGTLQHRGGLGTTTIGLDCDGTSIERNLYSLVGPVAEL